MNKDKLITLLLVSGVALVGIGAIYTLINKNSNISVAGDKNGLNVNKYEDIGDLAKGVNDISKNNDNVEEINIETPICKVNTKFREKRGN